MATIDASAIQPGDLMLHRGNGQISALIAWAGDSPFSHAAFVYDEAQVAEAATVGVRRMKLADRVVNTASFSRIDVYRPSAGITTAQLDAIRAVADGYMGTPYPMNQLVQLAIICAVRDKVPHDEQVRLLLREVTDHLIDNDPHHLVCSEFVYRAWAEAKLAPSIAPRIVVLDWVATPFPPIDWAKLSAEFEEDKKRAEDAQKAHDAPPAPSVPSPAFGTGVGVTADELRDSHAQLRDALGVPAPRVAPVGGIRPNAAVAGPVIEPNPNPRAILPADLGNSPDFRLLGTVLSKT